MAIKRYLDEQGLATLWEKIKNVFAKKADIPTVNNAKLTIKRNGTSVGTFTANQSTDAEVNITVPSGAAASKDVDTSIASGSTSTNLPTSKAVADHVSTQIKAEVTDKVGTTIAPLGEDGHVPASYLPSYVDDTIEGYFYNNKFYTTSSHTQEIAGETGKIYVDLSTNKTFRWSGTTFVNITNPIALGTTSGTAYDGASGAKNASDIATLETAVAGKVDKADGKGLSTNDYTTTEKNKLSNLSGSDADIVKNGGGITNAGTGLSKNGNTLNHSNAITAQATSKFVAVKVDAQGHISAIGDELTALTTTEITEILV